MNIISEITCHEMKKRWAIGEAESQFFYPNNQVMQHETLSLLQSGDSDKEEEGIRRHWIIRRPLLDSFPPDTKWFLGTLPFVEDEFCELKTIKCRPWGQYTRGSYLLRDAVKYLIQDRDLDTRISSIVRGFRKKGICLTGITFMSRAKEGPYVIAEGHARLIAIYYNCIIKRIKFENNELEVVLGVSQQNWCFSPIDP